MQEPVRIRPYRRGDEGALYEAARESVKEVSPWLPWCHARYSREEASGWVGTREAAFVAGQQYDFVIEDAQGRYLGGCGLNVISSEYRTANLGYWVRSSATGRGVASMATRQLAAFAFSKTELSRLEIVAAIENRASQRVAEKVGALREGVLHERLIVNGLSQDAVMYSLLKSRWTGSEAPAFTKPGPVILRAPTRRDQAEFLDAVRRSRLFHRPWVHPPATPEAYRAYLRRSRSPDFRAYLLCVDDPEEIAGVVNASEIVRGCLHSAYLGFYRFEPFRRRGVMTAGLAAVLRDLFRVEKLHRAEANIQPGNFLSQRLVQRLGFVREGYSPRYLKIGGRWRDHERWALIAERWSAR